MKMAIQPGLDVATGKAEFPQTIAVIRAEISAAQTLLKTVLVRRVLARLELNQPTKQAVNDAVDYLVQNKELLAIGRGLVAVAPLRAIELSSSRVLLLTAMPDAQLSALLGQSITGELKRCIEHDSEAIRPAIIESQGRLLSVADYAGLHNAPVANRDWLKELTRRQQNVMAKGYNIETIESYRCYQNQKWLPADDAADIPTLWRGENQYGKNVFIWADKLSLFAGRGQWLSGSDATRTRIALDNIAGRSHQLSYQVKEGAYNLALDIHLPINEFKALLCYSSAQEQVDGVTRHLVYPDCWDQLTAMLNKQLSIEFMEVV